MKFGEFWKEVIYVFEDDPKSKPRKRQWKHVNDDQKQRIKRRKQGEKCHRMTQEVAKALRIPFIP